MASNGRTGEPLHRVLGLLNKVKKSGTGWEASCPGSRHKNEDRHPSLSVGVGSDGRVLLNCKAGCGADEILAALRLEWSDLFEKSAAGNRIRRFHLPNANATHVREDLPNDKKMWWEHNGKNGLNGTPLADLPLYRLPELLAAAADARVIVTEGENAAQALADMGVLAVGTVTGAGAIPSVSGLAALNGHEVWLWPDNDEPGREHMKKLATKLQTPPKWIDWKDAPPKGDAADYIAGGGSADGIAALLRQTAVAREGPRLSIVRMSDVQPEPVEWLWRGRFARGKPTLLMGDPGLGKSLISHWLSATTSRGGEWPDGGRCERGTAILFTIEDGLEDTVAPRLLAANANMHDVIAVRGVIAEDATLPERMFALTDHLAQLEDLIVDTSAVVVVMDPISAYLGPDINSHRESDVRAVLGPLQLMAERTRVVLVMLMHLNKGTGVSALYRATGSIAFPAVARVVLGVAPDPNDDDGKRRLLLPVKMNIGKGGTGIGYRIETAPHQSVLPSATADDQPPVLIWDLDPVTIDATAAMDRNGSVQELGAVAEAKVALAQILANGRVPANECKRQLKEATGVSSETSLSRARKEMGVRVRREGFGPSGVWYWELADIDPSRARIESMQSMEPMEPMTAPSIDSIDSKGSIDSMVLPRAREDLWQPGVCRHCGRDWDTHGSRDPISCQWEVKQ